MERISGDSDRVFRTRLDASNRITLPQAVREQLHLSAGDELIVRQHGDVFQFETPQQALHDAQAYFSRLVEPGVSVVDELIEERRAEAARE